MEIWVVLLVYVLFPLIASLLWWWNEIWYVFPVKERCKLFNLKLPPGHLGLPLFGEYFTFMWYFHFLRRPDNFLNDKILRYGMNEMGAYRTYLYGSPTIIACSPSLCKKILTTSSGIKQHWPTASALGINSVITLEGSRHHLIKDFIAHEFTRRDSLAHIVPLVQPYIVAALRSWAQIGRINTFDRLKKVTLEYMTRYVVSLEVGSDIDALEKLFSSVNGGFRAQPWNIPGTVYHHAIQCRKKITRMLKEEMKKRKEGTNKASRNDIMDGLMQLKDNEGRYLRDEEVLDNVLSNIDVGYIGISYPVTWSMYFLAKNPLVLKKLREENMKMVREKKGSDLTYDDISRLKYTNKVVDETLRIASLAGFIFKEATQDIEFEGYMIPKGWKVILWLRHLHKDPSNFENPMSFNPDRWDSHPKPGTFFPFGGGPRTCPGHMLARVNVALFLHHLSVGYRWELINPDVPITYLSHPKPADGLEISFSQL